MIPDFEPIGSNGSPDQANRYISGFVPVIGKEGHDLICLEVIRYSMVTRSIHRALHRLDPERLPAIGRVATV